MEAMGNALSWIRRHPFAALFLASLFYILGAYLLGFPEIRSTRSWPSVSGRISLSELRTELCYDGDDWYDCDRAHINFSYVVDGHTYTSSRIYSGKLGVRAYKPEYTTRYPLGKVVLVHYDPQNPQDAVLITGANAPNDMTVIMVLVSFGLGALVLFVSFGQIISRATRRFLR